MGGTHLTSISIHYYSHYLKNRSFYLPLRRYKIFAFVVCFFFTESFVCYVVDSCQNHKAPALPFELIAHSYLAPADKLNKLLGRWAGFNLLVALQHPAPARMALELPAETSSGISEYISLIERSNEVEVGFHFFLNRVLIVFYVLCFKTTCRLTLLDEKLKRSEREWRGVIPSQSIIFIKKVSPG